MTLTKEDIEFIKAHMSEWLAERSLGKPPAVYEIELRERSARVEQELKQQRELMREGFEAMERRFEQVDKRFEQLERRFEAVDNRVDSIIRWSLLILLYVAALVVAAIKILP